MTTEDSPTGSLALSVNTPLFISSAASIICGGSVSGVTLLACIAEVNGISTTLKPSGSNMPLAETLR